VTVFLALLRLRFQEAMAGRLLWLVPIHLALGLVAVLSLPEGPLEERLAAGHAVTLALAGLLGILAAALLGATPLPVERGRARGALVLAGAAGPATRALASVAGSAAALLLITAGLLASSLAAVDLGLGAAGPPPRGVEHPVAMVGGTADPRHEGLVWLTTSTPAAKLDFGVATTDEVLLEVEAGPRVGRDGFLPGVKEVEWSFEGEHGLAIGRAVARSLYVPFRIRVPRGVTRVNLRRVGGNFDLGLRREGIRRDAGPRPRALARGLHAVALCAGLLVILAAATALSTVTGTGVAATGAAGLAALALSRSLFIDAARILGGSRTLGEALAAAGEHGDHLHAPSQGTPAAMAPVFDLLSKAVPDGTLWDLSAAVTSNRVPDGAAVVEGLVIALAWVVAFTTVAAVLAGRRS